MSSMPVLVVKRNGEQQEYDAAKIRRRFERVMEGLDCDHLNVDMLVENVTLGLTEEIRYDKLDELVAQTAAYAVTRHPDYARMGGRLCTTSLHKETEESLLQTFRKLHDHKTSHTNIPAPILSDDVWEVVQEHYVELQSMIDYSRDLNFDFFGYKTLERSYLLRTETEKGEMKIVERPQQMYMRVALGIHGADLVNVRLTYDLMSKGFFTHATPTLFNAGTPKPQMSSCFLVASKDDSIEGIYDTLKECALISKAAGGIGLHVHNIRAEGSYIAGTNGTSNGLVPMLRVFNNTARYVDQGGGKRKGAFAIYLEPWHADIFGFLLLKRNTGKDDQRARDLFYGLWVPDLFMERVENEGVWTLMDPQRCPGLSDCYGTNFKSLYEKYEAEGRGKKTIPAQELWFAILESQIETGGPFILFKDACNAKSNQKNLGTIKCSNLCTEIVEYTAPGETAVCNLASVALPRFVDVEKREFNHHLMYTVVKQITRNLNRVIDRNYYPVPAAHYSNMRNRPIAIGVQGLADAFILMRLPFTSEEARRLNAEIFETLYFAAAEASMEMAEEEGPYSSFKDSPTSKGVLQFDMWKDARPNSGRWDWATLKKKIVQVGLRNSLLVAPMPTASTSQILGNNECFEPFTSNIYVRRVLSGEFPVVNKYLVMDLIERGLWNEEMRNDIISYNGSVLSIKKIPEDLQELYRTVWEIPQRKLIDMARDRGQYIDQSQSMNLFLQSPTSGQITSMLFYCWKSGLKTGLYYLRTKAAADAIKFTVDPKRMKEIQEKESSQHTASSQRSVKQEECLNCGS
ncbi:hypothetical protein JKF63_03509 [Porcisia hertigi]|uniref:Ribonucleoside-diphosphate reductase n=1 Tax=Porcisia hertigi TaxID=2761500 RepID=A0A836HWM9_9TRYP|nr:hypothetical protein JKF63_03509 [Porcisia hertigi]